MPPAATLIDYSSSIEDPVDADVLVGEIEVEAIENDDRNSGLVLTRIVMMPRKSDFDEESRTSRVIGRRVPPLLTPETPEKKDSNRYEYLSNHSPGKCLADSFDSLDEIQEGSNEAKLLKRVAKNATYLSYNPNGGLSQPYDDPYFLDETEAKYLDVLDRHLEDTDPECITFSDLDNGPDDPHPRKNQAKVDEIIEHLLDVPCCECAQGAKPVLKSVLRPSKWTFGGCTDIPQESNFPRDRSVKFDKVDIREFKMTLGNHPSATSGPPVMLDWDTQPSPHVIDLESYEKARQPRRNRRQLKLSLQQRHGILVKERGFSFEEVKSAWQDALEIRKQRKETLERGLALMKWDEVWESTCRKISRLVDGSA